MLRCKGLFERFLSFSRNHTTNKALTNTFEVSNEISDCLQSGRPVVALESTIITHGMPYPENLRTALKIEDIVKRNGAVPATIAVLQGKVCIGLNEEKLDILASKKVKPVKISRRDLPYVLSKRLSGGTTVAATMALAYRAGIDVFVTGGIGGVHRGGETTMDISADLIELSRTPMTVVSAGVKSILDIGRTLEYLETQGVCVTTFGKTKDFPAFFTCKSGFHSPCNVENYKEAAQLIYSRDTVALESGILVAVPIPESQAAHSAEIEVAIAQALKEVQMKNICGKEVTPYVLERVQQLSGGASLKANVALIENNADVGSHIAVELSKLKSRNFISELPDAPLSKSERKFRPQSVSNDQKSGAGRSGCNNRPVVIGGAALDLNITCLKGDVKMNGSTYDGKVESSAGGVGRNLADCLTKLGGNPFFISAVGCDDNGKTLMSKMKSMDTSGVRVVPNRRTTTFGVLLNANGDCICIIGDMEILEEITPQMVQAYSDLLQRAPLVVIDGNIPIETMDFIFRFCSQNKIPVWVEPTDINKASKSLLCDGWRELLLYASPNFDELRMMHGALCGTNTETKKSPLTVESVIDECLNLGTPLLEENPATTLIVTLGPLGTVLITRQDENTPFCTSSTYCHQFKTPIRAVHYLPPEVTNIVNVSGAGDCFAATMIAAIMEGSAQDACIRAGQMAAMLSLSSHHTVPDSINRSIVLPTKERFNNIDEPKRITV